jgi:hypothetical protein
MPLQPGRFFFRVTSTVFAGDSEDCSGAAVAFVVVVVVVVGAALLLLRQEPIVDVYVLCW